ncbi:MAG TPA: YceI family protein [Acidimicrobiales bacterium]|nr:YceI family protein [Acidimicrobiales bacterium]
MTNTITPSPLGRTVGGRLVPSSGTYHVDATHTTVDFVARHLMVAKVRGTFRDVQGALTVGETPEDSSLDVTVGMSSVDTREEARDNHLRSADFFDVEQYPTMTYVATGIRAKGDRWVTDGQLTIHGNTRAVELAIEFLGSISDPWGGSRIAFSATGEIDREEFGLTWNAAIETGGVVVSRTIKIEIEAELVLEV